MLIDTHPFVLTDRPRLDLDEHAEHLPRGYAPLTALPPAARNELEVALSGGYYMALRQAWDRFGCRLRLPGESMRSPYGVIPVQAAADHPARDQVDALAAQLFEPRAALIFGANHQLAVDYGLAVIPGHGVHLTVQLIRPEPGLRLAVALDDHGAQALAKLAEADTSWPRTPTRGTLPATVKIPACWTGAHAELASRWRVTTPVVLAWSGWLTDALWRSPFWPWTGATTDRVPEVAVVGCAG